MRPTGAGTSPPPLAEGPQEGARSRTAALLVSLVRGYQLLRAGHPSGCRFVPSCSEFAVQAVEAHGAFSGTRLAVGRLLRCHPWGGHGIDLVPDEGAPCSR